MINKYIPENLLCTDCDMPLEHVDTGSHGGITWHVYKCPECDEIYTDEPDWDSMPGGADDY